MFSKDYNNKSVFPNPIFLQNHIFCTFQVNLRSLGEAAGLQAGDVIFSVDGQDISLLKHKEAQEAIKRAGHNFVLTVGRYSHGFFNNS